MHLKDQQQGAMLCYGDKPTMIRLIVGMICSLSLVEEIYEILRRRMASLN